MSAVVIDLAPILASRRARAVAPKAIAPRNIYPGTLTHDFTFWRGASGARYVHTVYALIECPELPAANVLLVRRHTDGHAEALRICRVEHAAQSLNLAEVRQTAAMLGANEVHVHLLAGSADARARIERDLLEAGDLAASKTLH